MGKYNVAYIKNGKAFSALVEHISREAAFSMVERQTGGKAICELFEVVDLPPLETPPFLKEGEPLKRSSVHLKLKRGSDGRVRGPGMEGF